jgi:hypothetical protein
LFINSDRTGDVPAAIPARVVFFALSPVARFDMVRSDEYSRRTLFAMSVGHLAYQQHGRDDDEVEEFISARQR